MSTQSKVVEGKDVLLGEVPFHQRLWNRDGMRHQFQKPTLPGTGVGSLAISAKTGLPEGIFVHGSDRTVEREFSVDIHCRLRADVGPAVAVAAEGLLVEAVQFLCPRCGNGLRVEGATLGGDGRPITVHWDRLMRSSIDGKFRPPITIEGTLRCEYLDSEISGVPQPGGGSGKCGWRGGIYLGRCLDHTRP